MFRRANTTFDSSHRPAVFVDPAITGKLLQRDDGSEVKMKFEAPKTQLMGILINGVLEQKLNWGLVLVGAMLAVGIELCGVFLAGVCRGSLHFDAVHDANLPRRFAGLVYRQAETLPFRPGGGRHRRS